MTGSEAIELIEKDLKLHSKDLSGKYKNSLRMAINALEKQIEMKKYCDENDCVDCPYHNISLKDNRCMNDFIIDAERK